MAAVSPAGPDPMMTMRSCTSVISPFFVAPGDWMPLGQNKTWRSAAQRLHDEAGQLEPRRLRLELHQLPPDFGRRLVPGEPGRLRLDRERPANDALLDVLEHI